MEKTQANIRIQELTAILNEANRKYYVENSPTLSDYEFDMLLKELESLERQYPEFASADSPSQRVGSDLKKEFEQHPHRYPMLSLGNTYDIPEIEAFAENNKITVYNLETGARREHDCNSALAGDTIVSGHGGGDQGIIASLKDLLNGISNNSVCSIRESCDNHMIAFAAEESRLAGGKLVKMDEFMKKYER